MLIDVTYKITSEIMVRTRGNQDNSLTGHMGTHFDVMDKEFPLEYLERKGIVFDVSRVTDRDIDITDINIDDVEKDSFVAFYTGFISREEYGTKTYFDTFPQLTYELIDALLDKEVSIIGVDCGGLRRHKEHTPVDQYCADRNVFVIENMCNLEKLVQIDKPFIMNTYPLNYSGMTGIPCRIIAKVEGV